MRRDEVAELERALREAPIPDEGPARERARRTVLAAAAEVRPRRRARRVLKLAWIPAVACLALAAVVARDTGPARAVERLVRDIVREPAPAKPPPAPAERSALPGDGRLLVSGADGLFVVAGDGSRTRLGRWEDATWSPAGLFVAATAGRTLAAIDPTDGSVRWRIRPGGRVAHPRWAPDRTHIAYRAGRTLRIVYGNGRHDVRAGGDMADVAAAWNPSEPHTIAWAARDGTVTVEDADTAKELWHRRGGPVRHLTWSPDGRRLFVGGRRNGTIHDLVADTAQPVRLPPGSRLLAAAFAPTGTRLALAVYTDGRTTVRVNGRTVLEGSGRVRDLEWSPDGRHLLAGYPAHDQWLIARTSARPRATALGGISRRAGAAWRTHGWCC